MHDTEKTPANNDASHNDITKSNTISAQAAIPTSAVTFLQALKASQNAAVSSTQNKNTPTTTIEKSHTTPKDTTTASYVNSNIGNTKKKYTNKEDDISKPTGSSKTTEDTCDTTNTPSLPTNPESAASCTTALI